MEQYFISSAGVKIPKLIYGTAWKEDKTAELVELALAKGFRGIDTACQPRHYKEPLVGEGIQRAYAKGLKREYLFLQPSSPPSADKTPMIFLMTKIKLFQSKYSSLSPSPK